jgi:hypothetical protein
MDDRFEHRSPKTDSKDVYYRHPIGRDDGVPSWLTTIIVCDGA